MLFHSKNSQKCHLSFEQKKKKKPTLQADNTNQPEVVSQMLQMQQTKRSEVTQHFSFQYPEIKCIHISFFSPGDIFPVLHLLGVSCTFWETQFIYSVPSILHIFIFTLHLEAVHFHPCVSEPTLFSSCCLLVLAISVQILPHFD